MDATATIERYLPVSIRAPREGSDLHSSVVTGVSDYVSIRAPREGSD